MSALFMLRCDQTPVMLTCLRHFTCCGTVRVFRPDAFLRCKTASQY